MGKFSIIPYGDQSSYGIMECPAAVLPLSDSPKQRERLQTKAPNQGNPILNSNAILGRLTASEACWLQWTLKGVTLCSRWKGQLQTTLSFLGPQIVKPTIHQAQWGHGDTLQRPTTSQLIHIGCPLRVGGSMAVGLHGLVHIGLLGRGRPLGMPQIWLGPLKGLWQEDVLTLDPNSEGGREAE